MKQTEIKKRQFMIATEMFKLAIFILLVRVIGDWGMTYLAAALEVYILLQILFIACIPDGIARLLKVRMNKGQYKNAGKVCKAAVGYCLTVGIIGCILIFALADSLMGGLLKLPEAAYALRFLAPLFLMEAVCAILQGYFQGIGTSMPTVIAGLLKQIFSLSFALLFAHVLYRHGEKVSNLLHTEKFTFMYGAGGITLGMSMAGLLTLCFLFFIYMGAGRKAIKRGQEGMRLTESSLEVLRLLMLTVTVEMGIQIFLKAGTVVGMAVYFRGIADTEILQTTMAAYGGFYAKYLLPVGFLTGIALLLCIGNQSNLINSVKKEEYKNAKNLFTGGIQTIFLINGFFAVINMVLNPGILLAIFGIGEGTLFGVGCMQRGFLAILFLPMGIYFMNLLCGLGRKKIVFLNVLGSFAVFLIVALIGRNVSKDSIYTLAFAFMIFTAVNCILNGVFVMKTLKYSPEWLHLFAMPALASVVTGLCLFLLNKGLVMVMGIMPAMLLGIVIGCGCYIVLLFTFRCIREKELYMLPGGGVLRRIGEILHILS
ncbi:MAG: polysaccharide biosynthesis C-terminal domain-containing protein [Lachnospiraceae bacterium]|nr:polysaccharide biosynthesis C-terminal domain-containing protein [Lachnospiraceae bacterium]